jgi:hypothetical protein
MFWKQRLVIYLKGASLLPCQVHFNLFGPKSIFVLLQLNMIWGLKNNLNHKRQLNFQTNSHWRFKILYICLTKCINLCLQTQNWQPKTKLLINSRLFSLNFLKSKNWRISSKKLGKSNLIYSRKIEISTMFPIVLPRKRQINKKFREIKTRKCQHPKLWQAHNVKWRTTADFDPEFGRPSRGI